MKIYGFLLIQLCFLCVQLRGETLAAPREVLEQYDSFPNNWCSLPQLKREASRLKDNNLQEARRISDEMKRRVTEDPEFSKLSTSDAEKFDELVRHELNNPYNHNRLGRENPSIYLGASEVYTEYQDFIMASCPKTKQEFLGVLTCFLDRIEETGLWVSLLCSNEAPNYCNNFWKADFLHQLQLPHGWVISKVTSSVIGGKPGEPNASVLTKTRIELCCGSTRKTILHYHYEGWQDRTGVPDEGLLLTLLDEMEVNAKKEVPIVINCRGGVGRTGMIAVTYLLRKEIEAQISKGIASDKVRINVPKTIYNLRKQRANLSSNPKHIYKIYSVLGTYCEEF